MELISSTDTSINSNFPQAFLLLALTSYMYSKELNKESDQRCHRFRKLVLSDFNKRLVVHCNDLNSLSLSFCPLLLSLITFTCACKQCTWGFAGCIEDCSMTSEVADLKTRKS